MKTKLAPDYMLWIRNRIIVLLHVFLANMVSSQNLVINPSFEDHTQCPSYGVLTTFPDQVAYATGWKSARREPLFFHSCSTSGAATPTNQFGTQPPATGAGYAYITAKYNGIELNGSPSTAERNHLARGMICGTLSSPLVPGRTYAVSYKVSYVSESSTMAIDKLGVDFSVNNTGCLWGGTMPAPSCLYPLTNTPDLWTDDIISDSENWTTLSWTYTATEPSKYIILGVFHEVTQEQHLVTWPSNISIARYYIDDVSVVEVVPCTVSVTNTEVTCHGASDGTATATIQSGDGPFTYSWSPAPGSGQGTPNPAGMTAQDYTLTVSNAIGSCTATTTIIQPPGIVADIDVSHPFCGQDNGSAEVTATGGTGNFSYAWDGNPAGNQTLTENLEPGQHTLTITDDSGCTANLLFLLEDSGLPIALPFSSVTITEGDSIQLSASGGSTYSWTPSATLSCDNCPNPFASPKETTVYTVTVTNAEGCSGSASVTVKVEFNCHEVFVPTIFSPNGDGLNDEICVMNNCISKMHLTIFNRWGEKVFESLHEDDCWDGNFKGGEAASGVFVYQLNALLKDGQKITRSGNITLVR